jgi:hypothetical protein
MLQLVFAIFFLISAWAGWRRNPLYSTRSTLRAVGVGLLAIAGAILLIAATVRLTENRSPVVFGISMGTVIIVVTLGLVYIVQTLSAPPGSKPTSLPHATHLVTNNRRIVLTWAKILGSILIGSAIPGLLIPGDLRYAFLVVAALAAFMAVILLPVLYWTNRGFDQSLTAIELDPWVHWQYTPEQWTAWCNVQADRLKATPPTFVFRLHWKRMVLCFAGIAGGVYICCPGGWLWKTIYIVSVCGFIAVIMFFSGRGGAPHAEKLRAKLLKADPEVYFGRDGIFCDGHFAPWLNISTYLVSAAIDERAPRSALFNFERSVPNPYGPTQVVHIHQAVLIPDGKQTDLARLQQELTVRCPTARVALA